jgi:hypothetical protein
VLSYRCQSHKGLPFCSFTPPFVPQVKPDLEHSCANSITIYHMSEKCALDDIAAIVLPCLLAIAIQQSTAQSYSFSIRRMIWMSLDKQKAHHDITAASIIATKLTNICWCCTGSSRKLTNCTGVQMAASAAHIGKECLHNSLGRSCTHSGLLQNYCTS